MRSMMLAAALALTSLVSHPVAEACGGYVPDPWPRLFMVDTSFAGDSFVVLNTPVSGEGVAWKMLYPRSYDLLSVAQAPDFTTPVTMTLVGPRTQTTITTKKQVFVANGFQVRTPTGAIRLAKGQRDVRVALFGKATNAKWEDLTEGTTTSTTRAWATRVGLDGAYLSRHEGGQALELLTGYGTGKVVTHIRIEGADHGSRIGTPMGIFSDDSGRYLVFRDETKLTTLRLS